MGSLLAQSKAGQNWGRANLLDIHVDADLSLFMAQSPLQPGLMANAS
jgi:hypothetical protein